MRLRKASSQRRRSARRIFANASSGWPTAMAQDAKHVDSKSPRQTKDLWAVARNWPTETWSTPRVTANKTSAKAFRESSSKPSLIDQARNWPTPAAAPEAPNTNSNTVNGPSSLGEAAQMWQTPVTDSFRSRGGDRVEEPELDRQARMWATPMARDSKGVDPQNRQGGESLPQQVAASWSTPLVDDLSHQARQMQMAGESTSPQADLRLLRPVLNPSFVEALMGWPSGATDYASSETAWCQWLQRMRSLLSQLGWEC